MLKKWISTVVIGTGAAACALGLGYSLYRPQADEPQERISITPKREEVTDENTVVEYIYNYKGDGITETSNVPIPPFLVGLTRSQAEQKMSDCEIIYFATDKVTAVKNFEGNSRQHYILGDKDGYIAVFYKNGMGLKEMTNMPVNAISEDEFEHLSGREIVGADELARVLENIES